MARKIILLITGFLITVSPLTAEEYDLQRIIKLAIERNNNIKLAYSDKMMASALKKQAVADALPSIDLDFGMNRNLKQSFFYFNTDQGVQRFSLSFKNEFQFNAILSQTLFSFKVGKAIQAASDFKKFTDFQYSASIQNIVTEAKKAFYTALLLEKIYTVAKESEDSARENYENIKLKYESGVTSEFDLLQAEVRWQNSIPETMQAEKNYQLSLNNLKALVNLPQEEDIELKGELETYPALPSEIQFEDVLSKRPDYQALYFEKKLREKNVFAERADSWPTLSGTFSYLYGARSDQFKLENDNDNMIVGVSLRMPLFTGGAASARIQQARIELNKTNTQIDLTSDNIHVELKNGYLLLREAYQRITAANRGIASARRAFEIAESRVQNNLATQLELKDSRLFLDQAQINYYSAIYDYLTAYYDWQRITGNVPIQRR